MTEWLSQPWPWHVSGLAIVSVMVLLLYLGKAFGVSSSFRAVCAAAGAGKRFPYFDYDWQKKNGWSLVFLAGALIGGFIANQWLSPPGAMDINPDTLAELSALGISTDTNYLAPKELFSWSALGSTKGLILIVLGGFLVGFGTRYAGGCTSGHAISGLSNLQLPSLVAVIGFFLGGLLMTHFIFPLIF